MLDSFKIRKPSFSEIASSDIPYLYPMKAKRVDEICLDDKKDVVVIDCITENGHRQSKTGKLPESIKLKEGRLLPIHESVLISFGTKETTEEATIEGFVVIDERGVDGFYIVRMPSKDDLYMMRMDNDSFYVSCINKGRQISRILKEVRDIKTVTAKAVLHRVFIKMVPFELRSKLMERALYIEIGFISGYVSLFDESLAKEKGLKPLSNFEKWLMKYEIPREKTIRNLAFRSAQIEVIGEDPYDNY